MLQVLAGGLESFLGYTMAELGPMWADPIRSMREEIAAHGTADDALCFDYVANKLSGTEPKVWPNGVMDAAREQPVSLDALVRHHDARAAGLERHEVLACRLYTTNAYKSINGKLRERADWDGPTLFAAKYPFPILALSLKSCVMKLRCAFLRDGRGGNLPRDLFRGMRDMELGGDFSAHGGTELAPMSTTADVMVALRYAASKRPLIFKLKTRGFQDRGADIGFLSAFPEESEFLFPPLTFCRPTGKQINIKGVTFVEVEPTLA